MREPRIVVYVRSLVDDGLTQVAQEISDKVREDFHLTYPDINFHMVDIDELSSVVAAGGWATFPQHWLLGQQYLIQRRAHQLGDWRIFEIVVDSGSTEETREPIDAYIYAGNRLVDIKLVMAHVFGHAHVFENNWRGRKTRLDSPLGILSRYKERIDELEGRVGMEKVEKFMDAAESLSNLIDLYPTKRGRKKRRKVAPLLETGEERRKRLLKKIEKRGKKELIPKFREYDVLKFLYENNELLTEWEREILEIQHTIAMMNSPVRLTKMLHEGFAALVDYRYCIESDLPIGEIYDYLKHRTASLFRKRECKDCKHRSAGVNPYALGFSLLTYVMEKWGAGQFGFEYEEEKYALRRIPSEIDWERGWDKVLEVVATNTDYTLTDSYFTFEFWNRVGKNMFTYAGESWEPKDWKIESIEYQDVKNTLLFNRYNGGSPRIYVKKGGGNYENRGELYLVHDVAGFDELGMPHKKLTLDPNEMEETLKEIHGIWRRRVYLETINEDGETTVETHLE